MVLSSGYGQLQLHQCSRQAFQHQKTKNTISLTHDYETAATIKDNPKIPNPNLFEFESKTPEKDNIGLPTVGECAAHLELLQAFHRIYVKISSSAVLDTVLGINPEPRIVYRKKYLGYGKGYSKEEFKLRDESFQERRKTKWNFYLALAAARFLVWAETVEKVIDEPVTLQATSLHLPPLGRLYHDFI